MLEEMSSEGVSGGDGGEVAAGDPGTTLNQVVLVIEGRYGEVVIDWVAFKSKEGVHSCMRPLPDIPHWIIHRSHSMFIHRTR